jgi:integrase
MAKGAQPFKYRGKWRAQVTLDNGKRPTKDFKMHCEAVDWIAEQLANANSAHEPALGGPKAATLADALLHYAQLYTVNKDGAVSELNRINHYLEAAGHPRLKRVPTETGGHKLEVVKPRILPSAFQKHNETRRAAREQTYIRIELLANKRCSAVSTADIRKLFSLMQQEGLGDSTIQKEVALLKHLFNVAASEWSWKGFKNPCLGIKLGKSAMRFVSVTAQERQALLTAVGECDNPFFWPLVEIARETTLRRKSLLEMRWDKTDLAGRVTFVPSKTGPVPIPLSQRAIQVLEAMPRGDSEFVFPMTANAVKMAWNGARVKAGLPTLQFRDLRHMGATDYARAGFNSHQLAKVLGHKTTKTAEVYVNLVNQDVIEAMDRMASNALVMQLPPRATDKASVTINRNRANRVVHALKARLVNGDTPTIAATNMPRVPAQH